MAVPAGTVKKLGPGVLTVGSVGTALDFSGRVTKASITWKVDTTDDTVVLDGSTIAGDRTYSATLEATVRQDDLTTGSLVDYTWAHKGTEVPFTFTPYSGGRSITGNLVIDPLDVGGDVNATNTADLKWECVGTPTLVDNLS
jgi:hypothetical protein